MGGDVETGAADWGSRAQGLPRALPSLEAIKVIVRVAIPLLNVYGVSSTVLSLPQALRLPESASKPIRWVLLSSPLMDQERRPREVR